MESLYYIILREILITALQKGGKTCFKISSLITRCYETNLIIKLQKL
jgi:hypothetical protein